MNYQFEKNKLKSYLGGNIYSSLKESKDIFDGGIEFKLIETRF